MANYNDQIASQRQNVVIATTQAQAQIAAQAQTARAQINAQRPPNIVLGQQKGMVVSSGNAPKETALASVNNWEATQLGGVSDVNTENNQQLDEAQRQVNLQTSEQAQADAEAVNEQSGSYVTLNNGELVPVNDYNNLTGNEKQSLQTLGVAGFNSQQTAKQTAFNVANIQVTIQGKPTYIARSDWNKLTPEQQAEVESTGSYTTSTIATIPASQQSALDILTTGGFISKNADGSYNIGITNKSGSVADVATIQRAFPTLTSTQIASLTSDHDSIIKNQQIMLNMQGAGLVSTKQVPSTTSIGTTSATSIDVVGAINAGFSKSDIVAIVGIDGYAQGLSQYNSQQTLEKAGVITVDGSNITINWNKAIPTANPTQYTADLINIGVKQSAIDTAKISISTQGLMVGSTQSPLAITSSVNGAAPSTAADSIDVTINKFNKVTPLGGLNLAQLNTAINVMNALDMPIPKESFWKGQLHGIEAEVDPYVMFRQQWNNLTLQQQQEVADAYNNDESKKNLFASSVESLDVAGQKNIATGIVLSPITTLVNPIGEVSVGQHVSGMQWTMAGAETVLLATGIGEASGLLDVGSIAGTVASGVGGAAGGLMMGVGTTMYIKEFPSLSTEAKIGYGAMIGVGAVTLGADIFPDTANSLINTAKSNIASEFTDMSEINNNIAGINIQQPVVEPVDVMNGIPESVIDSAKEVRTANTDWNAAQGIVSKSDSALLNSEDANTVQVAQQRLQVAQTSFTNSIRSLDTITPKQASILEDLSGYDGLTDSLKSVNKAQVGLTKALNAVDDETIGTKAYTQSINDAQVARQTLAVQTGKLNDILTPPVEIRAGWEPLISNATNELNDAQLELQRAQNTYDNYPSKANTEYLSNIKDTVNNAQIQLDNFKTARDAGETIPLEQGSRMSWFGGANPYDLGGTSKPTGPAPSTPSMPSLKPDFGSLDRMWNVGGTSTVDSNVVSGSSVNMEPHPIDFTDGSGMKVATAVMTRPDVNILTETVPYNVGESSLEMTPIYGATEVMQPTDLPNLVNPEIPMEVPSTYALGINPSIVVNPSMMTSLVMPMTSVSMPKVEWQVPSTTQITVPVTTSVNAQDLQSKIQQAQIQIAIQKQQDLKTKIETQIEEWTTVQEQQKQQVLPYVTTQPNIRTQTQTATQEQVVEWQSVQQQLATQLVQLQQLQKEWQSVQEMQINNETIKAQELQQQLAIQLQTIMQQQLDIQQQMDIQPNTELEQALEIEQQQETKTNVATQVATSTNTKVGITPVLGSGKQLKKKTTYPDGTYVWQQGELHGKIIYRLLLPPWKQENLTWSYIKPDNTIPVQQGRGSSYRSIEVVGGVVPGESDVNLGIENIQITTPENGKPIIKFARNDKANQRKQYSLAIKNYQQGNVKQEPTLYSMPSMPITKKDSEYNGLMGMFKETQDKPIAQAVSRRQQQINERQGHRERVRGNRSNDYRGITRVGIGVA